MPETTCQKPVDKSVGKPDPERVLRQLDSLPTLSAVAVRILQITSDSASSAHDLLDVLRADQSLTAKILSVASSAWSGARSAVTTLDRAIPLLGFAAVRSIVLSVSIFDRFRAGESSGRPGFQRAEFWKHAIAVACAARLLADAQRGLKIDPQDAFVAGLLHDLGKVALSAAFPEAYDRLAAQTDEAGGVIADFERSALGLDHTAAGRRLAERWHLPHELQEVIWLHHVATDSIPASAAHPGLIRLVQLANTIAREQRIGYSGDYSFYDRSAELAQRLGFSADQHGRVVRALVGDVSRHAELLGLGCEAPDLLYVQAIARANTELGRLNTELSLSGQRLAAGARYFRALTRFENLIGSESDPPAVVAAIAQSAAAALEHPRVAAFGVQAGGEALDVAWVNPQEQHGDDPSLPVSDALAAWLQNPGEALATTITHLPDALGALLDPAPSETESLRPWLAPIVHEARVVGGVVYWSSGDEPARMAAQREDLSCFLASLGLALGRAHAQAAARRLADELADANRRLQQMQAELSHARALSMIAETAAGAAHELNSPLTVISGRAQLLAQSPQTPDTKKALDAIQTKAHECSQIVSELMDFARPRAPRPAPVDLNELLQETRNEWTARLKLAPERLTLEAPASAVALDADREQIKTMLGELLANAGDAVAENGGSIALATQTTPGDGPIEIIVRDTGCGMTPEVLQRAFDPFFSHRRAGRARGLGLSRAYRVAESHGGRIWLESAPGVGTTAHVVLPRAVAKAGPK